MEYTCLLEVFSFTLPKFSFSFFKKKTLFLDGSGSKLHGGSEFIKDNNRNVF